MPGNSNDSFDFTGSRGGPEHTIGSVNQYVIHELDWDVGGHSSSQPVPRTGLPNIGLEPGQQGDIFVTADFLADAFGL